MNRTEIAHVFNIFHDGNIENEFEVKNNDLVLKISCTYLAELINKDYNFFYIRLINQRNFDFKPWVMSNAKLIISDISKILEFQLEIMGCDIENTGFLVTCMCPLWGDEENGTGGNLFIDADGIEVYDEMKNKLTIKYLDSICKQYWDNLGSKK